MKALVGYTGFVGSNIYAVEHFDYVFNSKNINEAFGLQPDLLVYAGLRAEKYLANNLPEKDMELIVQAEENIKNINPKKLVLISTVDVLKFPKDVDENTVVETTNLQAYGYNRYILECWVRENYPDALIIRLPGLFGKNIKKNFIYDYMNRIPFMLKEGKMKELAEREPRLLNYYNLEDNGFYKLGFVTEDEKIFLKQKFIELGFTALNFTDSRSKYQFYPLSRLWNDIEIALENEIRLFHLATEPISAGELYTYLTGETFVNELSGVPADYNFKTVHDKKFDGKNGYILNKEQILQMIKEFVD